MEARLGKNKVARRLGKNKNKIKFIDVLPTNDTITFNQFLPELFQEIKDIIVGVGRKEFLISHFSNGAELFIR